MTLTQNEKRVVELFQRLPAERRPLVILEMARSDADAWKRYQPQGEQRLRELALARNLDWDRMTDAERQDFVVNILDEGD